MKKLKGANRVHPSPPTTNRHLSSLPSAIMSLAAALSPEEQEVLAYLLSSAASSRDRWAHPHDRKRQKTHQPDLTCGCFSCYKSFWARWDSSPNRHVIHLILDAVEEEEKDDPFHPKGRNRRKRTGRKKMTTDEDRKEILLPDSGHVDDDVDDDDDEVDVEAEEESKSSVRRFVSFIGERMWGVWNN